MAKLRFVDYINSFQFVQIIENGSYYSIEMRGKFDKITGEYLNAETDQMIKESTYWVTFPKQEKPNSY